MTKKVLILGAYGNFGKRITTALVKGGIPIIIAGRNREKAEILLTELKELYPTCTAEISILDMNVDLAKNLQKFSPKLVINTCGPFQNANYLVAKTCINYNCNYIDLSDGRDFVKGIVSLDKEATKANVAIISGASTVPALSSAVLEEFKDEFIEISSLKFGISPGGKTPRGLATTQAILSYVGKAIKPFPGCKDTIYGWQGLYRQEYPELGKRWMANCDIPDLDLLPNHYNIKSIQFSAGMESSILHLGLHLFSWLIRWGLPINLPKYAKILLKIASLLDYFGTINGGMHVIINGVDKNNKPKEIKWFIIARNNDGPQIPCIPSIILAKKLVSGRLQIKGAMPCVGLITLEEYMAELRDLNISQYKL